MAKNTYFHAITVAKRRSWSNNLENADIREMWSAKATIIGRVNPSIPSFPNAPTPKDVRDEIVAGFFPLTPPVPPRRPHLPDQGYRPIETSEISAALTKCSNTSAPGPDEIPYGVWKNVHRASSTIIPTLLDPLLRWGVHPASLKRSLGFVLPKPGKKNYSETSSYRIIALLPTLSKILERIVASRLLPLAQMSGLIHPNQCGSLPGLPTSDAVAALRLDIGTAHRRGLRASTLLLDVKGGIDNVNPTRLSLILKKAGIPRHLRAWVVSFLSDRRVALVFQGGPRDFLPVFMGTPHRSPLSPLLFLIYVSCFHEERFGGVVFSYVDDFAITVFSRSYETNTLRVERWASQLMERAASLKLYFSLLKPELIHWRTIQQAGPRSKCTVHIGGTVTEPSRFVRWLGFWLEDNLSTVTHFTRRLALASAAFASVKAISHYGKGLNPRACRHIAQAFIRPILLYGANLLAPTKGCLLKMGYLWRRVARWVTNCFYSTNSAALLAEAAMQPLTITVHGLEIAYVARIAGTFPTLNPALARLPPDFPTPWADRSFRRVNHFGGVVGIRRPLPWRTAHRYNEPRIRLLINELAHRFRPLITSLSIVEPDRPCLPPYK